MRFILALAAAIYSLPSSANTLVIQQPTDALDGVFASSSTADVGGRLALACDDRRWKVVERSQFLITCAGDDSPVLLNRNVRSKPSVTFSLVEKGADILVRASTGSKITNGFGQERDGLGFPDAQINDVLDQAGARFPDNTKFVGNDLGVYGYDSTFFVVRAVREGSAAQAAGFQTGDEIMGVGKKFTKDSWALAGAFRKLPIGQPVQIEVKRGKQTIFLSADVRTRSD